MLLLNIYYVPGTEEPAVNKTEKKKNPHSLDLHIVVEERDSKETNW